MFGVLFALTVCLQRTIGATKMVSDVNKSISTPKEPQSFAVRWYACQLNKIFYMKDGFHKINVLYIGFFGKFQIIICTNL